jgi:hypothetical protein
METARRILKFKKRYLLTAIALTVVFSAYWLKTQMGINFFDSLSISAYFPFKYFSSNIISSPEPGIIFNDNFNTKSIFKNWSDLWMREKGTVNTEFSFDGFGGSRCLLIRNNSDASWTYSHNKRVEVNKGDIFYFEGLVNLNGNKPVAYLSVAAFDDSQKVVSWNLYKEKSDRTGGWFWVERQFTIDDGDVKYITFRLVGVGKGEYRFDNITFRKIN